MRKAIGLGALLLLSTLDPSTVRSQTRPERTNKPSFFRHAGFAEAALVDGARNPQEARQIRDYSIFESSTACYLLQPQENYVFALNNRHTDFGGTYWASFVTVIYHNSASRNYLSLYRNEGWIGRNGAPLTNRFETDSDRIDLSPQKFLEYHISRDAQARARAWAQFRTIAEQFHGRLRATTIDSWEFYPSVAAPIRRLAPNASALSARLYRYQVTARDTPERLVEIVVPRLGSTKFTLRVDTPGLGGEPTRYQRTFATNAVSCRQR